MIRVILTALSKNYCTGGTNVQALNAIDLVIEAGTFVAIIGYSGCGKTTLLRHIAGLEQPDSGTINFQRPAESQQQDRVRLGVVFQEPRLLPWLTVAANVELALHGFPPAVQQRKRAEALALVGLDDFAEAYPRELSGGMAQRVALARALCRDPHLLLLDEPFGALDALTRMLLQRELAMICSRQSMTVLFITHDIGEAVQLADRVMIMRSGRITDQIDIHLRRPRAEDDPQLVPLRRDIFNLILSPRGVKENQ